MTMVERDALDFPEMWRLGVGVTGGFIHHHSRCLLDDQRGWGSLDDGKERKRSEVDVHTNPSIVDLTSTTSPFCSCHLPHYILYSESERVDGCWLRVHGCRRCHYSSTTFSYLRPPDVSSHESIFPSSTQCIKHNYHHDHPYT